MDGLINATRTTPLRTRITLVVAALVTTMLGAASSSSAQPIQATPPGVAVPLPAAPPTATAENLPVPSQLGFTIPLATTHEQTAIKISDDEGLISLAVRDAPLRHVLATIADVRGLNLVYASSRDVPITATLDRVPIDEALDSLLSASGYTWARSGSVVYVSSLIEAEALPPNVQGRRVAVIPLDYASAADVDLAVKGLLSPVGQSWVQETSPIDNRRTTETIVVEDLQPYLARIEQFIAQADQPPRQVLIEAHILEVDLERDRTNGVNLEALADLTGSQLTLRSTGLANPNASPGFFIEASGGELSPVIEALISTTDAKTLANPRLLAVNGQQARIQIGAQLGFRVTTTTETSTLESVDFIDVGVVLTVTPRITRDGRVLMRIRPEVSSGAVDATTGLPEEETTEVETDVLLNNGQGMIIGGLIQERDTTTINKVPLLGSIPYAGFFFQRRELVKTRSEIIVALVPHVTPYSPLGEQREREQLQRATDPLLHGPLCRFPRPYEPQLRDVLRDHPPRACRFDDPHCDGHCATHASCETPRLELRRLPPVEATPIEVMTDGEPVLDQPQLSRRPTGTWRR